MSFKNLPVEAVPSTGANLNTRENPEKLLLFLYAFISLTRIRYRIQHRK